MLPSSMVFAAVSDWLDAGADKLNDKASPHRIIAERDNIRVRTGGDSVTGGSDRPPLTRMVTPDKTDLHSSGIDAAYVELVHYKG